MNQCFIYLQTSIPKTSEKVLYPNMDVIRFDNTTDNLLLVLPGSNLTSITTISVLTICAWFRTERPNAGRSSLAVQPLVYYHSSNGTRIFGIDIPTWNTGQVDFVVHGKHVLFKV